MRPTHAHTIRIGANGGLYRFFEIESLTTIALIVLHYRIEVLEEPQFAHETLEQRRERVLEAHEGALTLTPTRLPLQLIRRNY